MPSLEEQNLKQAKFLAKELIAILEITGKKTDSELERLLSKLWGILS